MRHRLLSARSAGPVSIHSKVEAVLDLEIIIAAGDHVEQSSLPQLPS